LTSKVYERYPALRKPVSDRAAFADFGGHNVDTVFAVGGNGLPESCFTLLVFKVNTIQEQYVEIDVQVQHTAKLLYLRNHSRSSIQAACIASRTFSPEW
jgi:hypothetical protein